MQALVPRARANRLRGHEPKDRDRKYHERCQRHPAFLFQPQVHFHFQLLTFRQLLRAIVGRAVVILDPAVRVLDPIWDKALRQKTLVENERRQGLGPALCLLSTAQPSFSAR